MVNMFGAGQAYHFSFNNGWASIKKAQIARNSMKKSIYTENFRNKDFLWCPPSIPRPPKMGRFSFLTALAALTGFVTGLFGAGGFFGAKKNQVFTPQGGILNNNPLLGGLVKKQNTETPQTTNQQTTNQQTTNQQTVNNTENEQAEVAGSSANEANDTGNVETQGAAIRKQNNNGNQNPSVDNNKNKQSSYNVTYKQTSQMKGSTFNGGQYNIARQGDGSVKVTIPVPYENASTVTITRDEARGKTNSQIIDLAKAKAKKAAQNNSAFKPLFPYKK